ncbi:MAG: protein GlmU [Desulfosalsimonas sp.]
MTQAAAELKTRLISKGVHLPAPEAVEISPDIDPERISGQGVSIHAGCRLLGPDTWIGPGAEIGFEAPATIENCCIGPDVQLKGGFFSRAVFLAGAACGSCAHVRSGTILEEKASIAHSVGLKQSILLPYVTLGSLINFCDCLMAGGTDAKNHSEVGSAYIHFNFTPQQDKATPSLIGDVPGGVMLDKPPIFLGGQGGLVGPCRLAYGITIAAGTICRKDELRPNRLIFGGPERGGGNIAYSPGAYRNVKRLLTNNLVYIGNLLALGQWYRQVRGRLISEAHPEPLHQGLLSALDGAVSERIKRLDGFFENLARFGGSGKQQSLVEKRCEISEKLKSYQGLDEIPLSSDPAAAKARDRFLESLHQAIADTETPNYPDVIQALAEQVKSDGSQWLQAVVDMVFHSIMAMVPEFQDKKGS